MDGKDKGKLVLITGASSGIGAAFAEQFAARGADVVLVARRAVELKRLAERLQQHYGVQAHVLVQDLTEPDAADELVLGVAELGRHVDVLVNNAGFGSAGPFASLDPSRLAKEVDLDVRAVVTLARAFLPGMAARGSGAMITVASLAAFQPTPYMAVYAASKSFVLSFSQALAAEHRDSGVQVLAVCPGPVDTEFFDVVGVGGSGRRPPVAVGPVTTADALVRAAFKAYDRGRTMVSPGVFVAGVQFLNRLLPRRLVLWATLRRMRAVRLATTPGG